MAYSKSKSRYTGKKQARIDREHMSMIKDPLRIVGHQVQQGTLANHGKPVTDQENNAIAALIPEYVN